MHAVLQVESVLAAISSPWNADDVETSNLDFKETPETAGDTGGRARKKFYELLAETAVCFSNAAGGTIVVGVRDRAPTREEAIQGIGRHTVDELIRSIFERTTPPITTHGEAVEVSGKIVAMLQIDRLLHHAAHPRNRLLSENLSRLGLAEAAGLGLDRVFKEVARLGKEPPRLQDGTSFRVTFAGGRGDAAFTRFISDSAEFPPEFRESVDVLTILTALRNERTVTAGSLAERLQRDPEDRLASLRKRGIIDFAEDSPRRGVPGFRP